MSLLAASHLSAQRATDQGAKTADWPLEDAFSSPTRDFARSSSKATMCAASALSKILSIENIRKDEITGALSHKPHHEYSNNHATYSSSSFYASYNSDLGLPDGLFQVPLELHSQPKRPMASSADGSPSQQCKQYQQASGVVSCGELIRSLLDYFRGLEAVHVSSSPMPFNGSTRELCLDDLGLLPAEEDGTVIDDLPLFSETTDIMSLGISDFILYDHERDVRVAHVHLELRAAPTNDLNANKSVVECQRAASVSLDAQDPDEEAEDWNVIQVFRTDTDEDMARTIENCKQSQPASGAASSSSAALGPADVIASMVAETAAESSRERTSSHLLAHSPNRMRSSSGNLVVSCKRPGSQRWRVAHRVQSVLVDVHSDLVPENQQKQASGPPPAPAETPRRHSDRPQGRFSHDAACELETYVRKFSESSKTSRENSLGPSYALNRHTSSLTPCFSPSAPSRESEAMAIFSAYGRTSASQDSFRTNSKHSGMSEEVSLEVEHAASFTSASDPFIDIPYSKPRSGARPDVLHMLSHLSMEDNHLQDDVEGVPSDHFDGLRSRTRSERQTSFRNEAQSARGVPPLSPRVSPLGSPRTPQTKSLSPKTSTTSMSSSFASGTSTPTKQTSSGPPTSLFKRFVSNLFGTKEQDPGAAAAGGVSKSRKHVTMDPGLNYTPRTSLEARGSSEFHSNRESLVRSLGIVQNLDTGETFPVGELLLDNPDRQLDKTVSPHALYGASRRV